MVVCTLGMCQDCIVVARGNMLNVDMRSDTLKLCSLNVNGLRNRVKRKALMKRVREAGWDIILFQETHSDANVTSLWKSEWGGQAYFANGDSASRGVAVFFRRGLSFEVIEMHADPMGRYLILHLSFQDKSYWIGNIYAPTQQYELEQISTLNKVEEILSHGGGETILLGGDFNIQLDPGLDRKNSSYPVRAAHYRLELLDMMERLELIDIWRVSNPTSRRYSFHRGKQASRIDMWLMAECISGKMRKASIVPGLFSDHSIIFLEIDLDNLAKGPGWWKFNNSLLHDGDYVNEIKHLLVEMNSTPDLNPNDLWDFTKYKVKGFSIEYCKKKNARLKKEEKELEENIKVLAFRFDEGEDVLEELQSYSKDLEMKKKLEAQAAILRSKANWASHSERPTKYFLNLEKKRALEKQISAIEREDGSLTTEFREVMKAIQTFYKNLYSSTDRESYEHILHDVLDRSKIPQLSDRQRVNMDMQLSEEEVYRAICSMKNNKSPGSDGLTSEFYKFFWENIKDLLVNSFSYSFGCGILSKEQRRGIIRLIPKKASDKHKLSNWRPITLLNTDYKILTKTLANRLKKYLSDIIYPDQTGFVKGRYIGTNIRIAEDIILYTSQDEEPSWLLALDFKKAFDSVSWECIIETLELFGFGDNFLTWIKAIYNETEACVTNNGYNTSWFYPTRGTRQGCCLSPFLFVIVAEVLAIIVRESETIEGIKVSGRQIKISLFADDVVCYCKSKSDLFRILDHLERFRRYSGLTINRHKTKLLQLGKLNSQIRSDMPFEVVDDILLLGIKMGKTDDDGTRYKWNFEERLNKCKRICHDWTNRNLSIKGKVVIVNSLLVPILLYPATITFTPKKVYVDFKKIICNFIWSSSVNRIAYATMCRKIKDGGLGLLDLETMISVSKVNWVKRLCVNDFDTWTLCPRSVFGVENSMYIFFCTKNKLLGKTVISPFYRDMYATWNKLYNKSPVTNKEIQNEILWNNERILIGRKVVEWRHWRRAGVLKVNDLISQQGEFMSKDLIFTNYGIRCNFLELLQIKRAIPWIRSRMTIQDISPRDIFICYEEKPLNIFDCSSKMLYNVIAGKINGCYKVHEKWEEDFPEDNFSLQQWQKLYSVAFISSRETKLQSLQFKIIHRIVPCRNYLFKRKIIDSPECRICGETDTLVHFFLTCRVVRQFLVRIGRWLEQVLGFDMRELSDKDYLLGLVGSGERIRTINFVFLWAKFYIYRQRLFHDSLLDVYQWIYELRCKIAVENYICQQDYKQKEKIPCNVLLSKIHGL